MVDTFTPALRAIRNLLEDGFTKLNSWAGRNALAAHAEIEPLAISQKRTAFFRHFLPLRRQMVVLLAESYRRYFRPKPEAIPTIGRKLSFSPLSVLPLNGFGIGICWHAMAKVRACGDWDQLISFRDRQFRYPSQ